MPKINAQSKANKFFQKHITKLLIQFLATSWLNMWSHTDVKQINSGNLSKGLNDYSVAKR